MRREKIVMARSKKKTDLQPQDTLAPSPKDVANEEVITQSPAFTKRPANTLEATPDPSAATTNKSQKNIPDAVGTRDFTLFGRISARQTVFTGNFLAVS